MDFDLNSFLTSVDPQLLADDEGRRVVTRLSPMWFALIYLPHHLKGKETGDEITFSEFHLDLIEQAIRWVIPDSAPRQHRDCYVAPRNCGKSTWLFTILPLWAAAHGLKQFISAFADSATQAQMHLQTFRRELEHNELLRHDYPDLCTPARKSHGAAESDNTSMYIARSGFVFAARGADSRTLGMKVGNRRPDLLILDDIEPPEENYSIALKEKRLGAIQDSILPLNEMARVVIVGTVTMPDSIIHDLVRSATIPDDAPEWIAAQNIRTHYYPALISDEETGEERSIWPARWPLDYLLSIRGTRDFQKNFMNDPAGSGGEYWRPEDFTYTGVKGITRQLLSIDPAVTSTNKSDYTALAVVGYSALEKRCVVRDAWQLRIQPGEPLRQRVLQILDSYPDTMGVLIETNQGGDTWNAILHHLPVKIYPVHPGVAKEVRAAHLLNHYQRGRVVHEKQLPAAEMQMVSFPKAPHDDLVDAIGHGVAALMPNLKKRPPATRTVGVV